MTVANWRRVRELVAEALELDPWQRAEFVARNAQGDAELEGEVLALLELEPRAERMFAGARPTLPAVGPGSRFERWTIERKLGEGGMGTVWLASRADTGQRVALKLVHSPLLTAAARRRFDVEQRALARLEHPGITRLVDAGVGAEGLPFLAMEFVDGIPIGQWCDERQLGVEQRIALFRGVCEAVHAAHQRLVVHGDIKPSNVLVDREGRVRLCDFGISRLLDVHDEAGSRPAPHAFTPRYASPEQLRGELLTTASDVHALGRLLHELLCGAEAGAAAAPSTTAPGHASGLGKDLDAIVRRCLAEDPALRYASAAALAEDLRRHLADEPISARIAPPFERLRRAVRRHRWQVALGAIALGGLTASLVVTLDRARTTREALARESSARALAERRFASIRELATTLVFDAHDAIRDLPGSTRARELLADSAARHLDALAKEAGEDALLTRELARAEMRLADALGRPVDANLGRTLEARERYARALELADRDAEDLELRARIRAKLADLDLYESRPAEAERLYGEALALQEQFEQRPSDPRSADPTISSLHERLAEAAQRQGRLDEAERHAAESLTLARAVLAEQPERRDWNEQAARTLLRTAAISLAQGDAERAVEQLEEASERLSALLVTTPSDASLLQRAAQTHGDLGSALARVGRHEQALERLELAVTEHRGLLQRDWVSAAHRDDLAVALRRLGSTLCRAGRAAEAVEPLREAVELARSNASLPQAGSKARRSLAVAMDELGGALASLGRDDEALPLHAQSTSIFGELAAAPDADPSALRGYAVSLAMLGDARLAAARREGTSAQRHSELRSAASSDFRSALEIVERLAREGRLAASDGHVPDWLRRKLESAGD